MTNEKTTIQNVGHCYAIEFDNGTVKIGKTINPSARFNAHRTSAKKFGVSVVKAIISMSIPFHDEMEEKLLSDASSICTITNSKEYFSGITIDDCCELFRRNGVGYVKVFDIVKTDKYGRIMMYVDLEQEISNEYLINKKEECNKKSESTPLGVCKSKIIKFLLNSDESLSPSVIAQRVRSRYQNIDDSVINQAMLDLTMEGILSSEMIEHAKTKLKSKRYFIGATKEREAKLYLIEKSNII